MTTRQLLVWPEGADLEPVKQSFLGLNAPFQVKPHWYQAGNHSGRVLVLADGFKWMHDHIYPKSPEVLGVALEWVLGLRELEVGPRLTIDLLSKAIGGEVREIARNVDSGEEDS